MGEEDLDCTYRYFNLIIDERLKSLCINENELLRRRDEGCDFRGESLGLGYGTQRVVEGRRRALSVLL